MHTNKTINDKFSRGENVKKKVALFATLWLSLVGPVLLSFLMAFADMCVRECLCS